MNWRVFMLAGLVIFLSAAALLWWMSQPPPVLNVATWAGPYGRAQANAMFRPYMETHRATVRIADHDGGLGALKRQVESGHYAWNVVDLELPDAVAACDSGLLEKFDPAILAESPQGKPAKEDFVPGAIGPCWIGSIVYSQIIAYRADRFGEPKPATLADFFDTVRFPGPRGLSRRAAKFNLELALLADGVAPDAVYRTLQTPQGVARAFAKLDKIRGAIVWWDSPAEPRNLLQSGQVRMTTMLNGTVFDAAMAGDQIAPIWDRQLYEFDVFAIPKGSPRQAMAKDFIRFATGAPQLARMAAWVPYGPARRSALPLVGENPDLKIAMRPYLPTAPENFKTAFRIDDEWWHANAARIAPLWQAWCDKEDTAHKP